SRDGAGHRRSGSPENLPWRYYGRLPVPQRLDQVGRGTETTRRTFRSGRISRDGDCQAGLADVRSDMTSLRAILREFGAPIGRSRESSLLVAARGRYETRDALAVRGVLDEQRQPLEPRLFLLRADDPPGRCLPVGGRLRFE